MVISHRPREKRSILSDTDGFMGPLLVSLPLLLLILSLPMNERIKTPYYIDNREDILRFPVDGVCLNIDGTFFIF